MDDSQTNTNRQQAQEFWVARRLGIILVRAINQLGSQFPLQCERRWIMVCETKNLCHNIIYPSPCLGRFSPGIYISSSSSSISAHSSRYVPRHDRSHKDSCFKYRLAMTMRSWWIYIFVSFGTSDDPSSRGNQFMRIKCPMPVIHLVA